MWNIPFNDATNGINILSRYEITLFYTVYAMLEKSNRNYLAMRILGPYR